MANRRFEKDYVRIKHMLDAAAEAQSFTKGKSRTDLNSDRMLVLAVLKEIEIIGEAAGQISDEFREKFSEVPWRDIVATRNRLIHGYFDIDLDIVWNTIERDLPGLIQTLQNIFGQS